VRAAVIERHGEPPVLQERHAPAAAPEHVLVHVSAAPIVPLDLLCASGASYFGPPPLPYIPGVQGVGTLERADSPKASAAVWFQTSAGMRPGDGSLAELCAVAAAELVPLPDGVDPSLAAALGLSAVAAWMALRWRGELQAGEQVLILGAGGMVGQVALQVARLGGARRVVAACRSPSSQDRARRLGADAVVPLTDSDDVDSVASRLMDACDGPVDLVLDPLFGTPAAAALRTLAPHGRLVNLGDSAGPAAPFESSTLRSRSLRVLGYTNNELSREQRNDALLSVLQHAAAGRIQVEYDRVPFAQAALAWSRQSGALPGLRPVLMMGDAS
jgi:NADPH:quinone reductase-like Zn-dependent oxidoreductase